MGAYPTAQNQLAAGYGLQPQGWPQVAPSQGQQWNPGYTQQVFYPLSAHPDTNFFLLFLSLIRYIIIDVWYFILSFYPPWAIPRVWS